MGIVIFKLYRSVIMYQLPLNRHLLCLVNRVLALTLSTLMTSGALLNQAYAENNVAPQLSAQAQSEEARQLWSELHESLSDLGKRWGEHSKLPEWSAMPWKNSQRKNKKKIDQIAVKLMQNVGNSPLDKVLQERETLEAELKALSQKIVKLEEESFSAPVKGGFLKKSRADYEALITQEKKKQAELKQKLQANLIKVRKTFEAMGLSISQTQVNDLFVVITGESMRNFFIRFSNLRILSEVIAHHISKSQSGQGYAGQAKRYYAIYVALVYMLVEIHEVTIKKITTEYIPKVEELAQRTQAQINETEVLLSRDDQAGNRETFEKNLTVQKHLYEASKHYKKYLLTQTQKIKATSKELQLRFEAVLNTYQTISLAESLLSTIKSGVKSINDLNSLSLPEMLPLSDEKLHEEFKLITGKLENNNATDWNQR